LRADLLLLLLASALRSLLFPELLVILPDLDHLLLLLLISLLKQALKPAAP
jgi:hypothetical protein